MPMLEHEPTMPSDAGKLIVPEAASAGLQSTIWVCTRVTSLPASEADQPPTAGNKAACLRRMHMQSLVQSQTSDAQLLI